MKSILQKCVAVAAFLAICSSASAVTILPTGEVDGWGITPFTNLTKNAVVTDLAHGVTSYLQNDWAPIDYPRGIGHTPSPGGRNGERYDLEEMHVRRNGTEIQMLLVASSLFDTGRFTLGDLVLNIDDDPEFDLGLITTLKKAGLNPGDLFSDITVSNKLENAPGGYRNHSTIEPQAVPWKVKNGMFVSSETINTASYDYGNPASKGNNWENNTHIYEFIIDFADVGIAVPDAIDFHITWGCGNDVIGGTYNVPEPADSGGQDAPLNVVPEPTTAAFGSMAFAAIAATTASRRRRA